MAEDVQGGEKQLFEHGNFGKILQFWKNFQISMSID